MMLGVLVALLVIIPPVVLGIVGLALILAMFVRPRPFFLLLVILTPVAFVANDLYPSAHYAAVRDIFLVALAVACLASALVGQKVTVPSNSISWALMVFCALVLVYVPLGPSPIQALLGAKALILYASFFFLAIQNLKSEHHLRLMCAGIAATSLILVGYALFSYFVPQQFFPYNPDTVVNRIWDGKTRLHFSPSTYFFAQFIPLLWLTATAIAERRFTRVVLAVGSGLAVAVVVLSELRAAWLALLITTAIYLAGGRKKILPAVTVGLIAVGLIIFLDPQSVLNRVSITGTATDIGFSGRLAELQNFWFPLIQQHPFGLGTGTFTGSASFAWQPVLGPMTFAYAPNGVTHNGYLEILGELGIAGFAAYLWLLASMLTQIRRNSKLLKKPLTKGLNTIALGAVLSYCAMNFLVPSPILFPVNVYFYLVAGLVVVLPRIELGAMDDGRSRDSVGAVLIDRVIARVRP